MCVEHSLWQRWQKQSIWYIYIYIHFYISSPAACRPNTRSPFITPTTSQCTHIMAMLTGYHLYCIRRFHEGLVEGQLWGQMWLNINEENHNKLSTDFQNHIFWNGYNSCPKHQAIQMNYQLGAASWYKLPTQWLSGLFDTSIFMRLHSSLCSQTLYFLPGRWWVHLLSLCQYSN